MEFDPQSHNLPAFFIFHDAMLRTIAEQAQQSLDALRGISEKNLAFNNTDMLQICAEPAFYVPDEGQNLQLQASDRPEST